MFDEKGCTMKRIADAEAATAAVIEAARVHRGIGWEIAYLASRTDDQLQFGWIGAAPSASDRARMLIEMLAQQGDVPELWRIRLDAINWTRVLAEVARR